MGDATRYYDIIRSHMIVAPAQVRKTERHDAERYTVLYELAGMVFAAAVMDTRYRANGLTAFSALSTGDGDI